MSLQLKMANVTTAGTGQDQERDGRVDYTDKSDAIREQDCIWCMVCGEEIKGKITSQT